MKKLSMVAMIATLFCMSAFAGEHTINAVGRAGWIYNDNDSKTDSNSSSFNIDYLRTTFAGTVTPSVKYFLTTDFLTVNDTTYSPKDSVDGTSPFIDEAFLTKTFSNGTSVIIGKKAILVGGREYDYLNFDRYTTSYFFRATPSNQVGLTLTHEIAGQTLMAQYFNGNKDNGKVDSNNTAVNAQSKFGWSVGWNGSLMNGMIKPIVAYTVIPEAGGAPTSLNTSTVANLRANKGNDNFMSAGLQFNTPHDVVLEVDYDLLTEKDAVGATAATRKDLKTTSIVGLIRYAGERFSPFVKYIADTRKTASVKTAQRSAYDVGVEFKESKDDAVRYHVVYSGATVKESMNTTEVKNSPKSIMVGLKFDAAVLK